MVLVKLWLPKLSQCGNPTRSIAVNALIKRVKREEVRKLGKSSCARRPLEPAEFEYTVRKLCEDQQHVKKCYLVSAAAKFQFHMIARLDDTCRFEFKDLKTHPQL